jgi:hypothetical protein
MLPTAVKAASAHLVCFAGCLWHHHCCDPAHANATKGPIQSVSSARHVRNWDVGIWHGVASALAIVVASICFTGCLRFTSHLCMDPGTFTGLQLDVGAVICAPTLVVGVGSLCICFSGCLRIALALLQLLLGALSVDIVATVHCCLSTPCRLRFICFSGSFRYFHALGDCGLRKT